MRHAAWRGVSRAAIHGKIRSMLEQFSFSSVVPPFRHSVHQVMQLRRIPTSVLLTALFASAANAQSSSPSIARYFQLARAELSGERARELVAFMDPTFRWPGNHAFDRALDRVIVQLRAAGYVPVDSARKDARLVYRIEQRPMRGPAWDLIDASLTIVGDSTPLLTLATNLNMLAINSYSTADSGVVAEVVDVGPGSVADYARLNVAGKIVLADGPVSRVFNEAVGKRGAVGVLAYNMPAYTRPEINRSSIQFGSVPLDTIHKRWGMPISRGARDAMRAVLARGPVRVRAIARTRFYPSVERTVVAEVRGTTYPDERFVISAHVQEPGANDNASGVGTLAEMARVLAKLSTTRAVQPERTVTMIFGNEIAQTRNFLAEDSVRARQVKWGLSLDMVGEDTKKTGGTFLIEKMPDPSAVWTRGQERHSEWGGSLLPRERIVPHYFNDFLLARCLDQARTTGWVVRTNPYEGGSDHAPFLEFGRPGVLFWHFTDQFYHTDGDRIGNVSADELHNVGVAALVSALTLTTANGAIARDIIAELEQAAIRRLEVEAALSRAAIEKGGSVDKEREILETWTNYYVNALAKTADIEVGTATEKTVHAISKAQKHVADAGSARLQELK
jgi:aminopeptidase YwaD